MPELFDEGSLLIVTSSVLAIFVLIVILLRRYNFLRFNNLISLLAFSFIYLLGFVHVLLSEPANSSHHILNIANVQAYTAVIQEQGVEKSKTIKYELLVDQVKADKGWRSAKGQIIAYISKEASLPYYGDKLLIGKRPQKIQPPANPHQFDYKRYINLQGIYQQQFLKDDDYVVIERGLTHPVLSIAYDIRIWALDVFNDYVDQPKERSIVQALILGFKDNLDRETRDAYASSGAMHILAVSGLHVGIIYGLFYFLLSPMRKGNKSKWLFAVLALIVLWTYAAVTGFSPSVSRAVTMFSFIVVAEVSGRNTNIYNTLAASAFVLLLYDPMLILSVGFQLSYLAVVGIVYIQPRIYQWWLVENRLLEKVWSLTTVAIAVQLVTFPLGLYYFHQFPSLFFISNLAAIPGALIILILGFLLLAVSGIPSVAGIVGSVLEYVVYALNYIMSIMQKLPINKISDVDISGVQLALLYAFTLSIIFMFSLRQRKLIFITLISAICFSFIEWRKLEQHDSTKRLVFYDLGNHSAIDFVFNHQSVIYGDSMAAPGNDSYEFNIHANHIANGVKFVEFNGLKSSNTNLWKNLRLLNVQGQNIVIVEEGEINFEFNQKVYVDYILLSNRKNVDAKWLEKNFVCKKIIIGRSVPYWKESKLKERFKDMGISYHSLRDDGAFEVDL